MVVVSLSLHLLITPPAYCQFHSPPQSVVSNVVFDATFDWMDPCTIWMADPGFLI